MINFPKTSMVNKYLFVFLLLFSNLLCSFYFVYKIGECDRQKTSNSCSKYLSNASAEHDDNHLIHFSPENHNRNSQRSNISCSITFVSAYFKVESKHSDAEYELWISNLISNRMCLVFYYNSFLPNVFQSLNTVRMKSILLVPINLTDTALTYFELDLKFWTEEMAKDPEINIHKGYELYWIWGLKSHFLSESSVVNPFMSDYFFWIDAGCIRSEKYTNRNWIDLTPPQHVRSLKGIFFVNLYPFTSEQTYLNSMGHSEFDFSNENHIAGAIFGGQRESMKEWESKYLGVFRLHVELGRFVGKDQTVYASTCIENMGFCHYVKPRADLYDVWFNMIPFIVGEMDNAVIFQ